MRNARFVLGLALVGAGCGDTTQVLTSPPDFHVTVRDGGTSGNSDFAGNPQLDMTTQQGGGDMAMQQGGGDMATSGTTHIKTVFTIVLENTSYTSIVGSSNAPYINSLIAMGGLATMYQDSGTHPSLPNYLYLTSGDPQYPGYLDISPTTYPFPVAKDNLGQQMTMAGIKWRAYMESMGTPCNLSDNSPYAAKHNPFVYFTDLQMNQSAQCSDVDVDYTNFASDLAGGQYRFMWITPNLNSDGHDTDLATADTWMSQNVPAILNSQVFQDGGVLFVTWDEGEGTFNTDDHVPMIVVSPFIKQAGMKLPGAYTHASYLKYVEELYGVPLLGAAGAQGLPSLSDFLN